MVAHAGTFSRESLRYIGKGLLVTAILVVVKIGLENTSPGRAFEQYTYTLLLRALPQFHSDGQSVVVVNISHIPGGSKDLVTGAYVATSRSHLREVLDVLASLQPHAVAVDIDFSPAATGWIDNGDPDFLDYCLDLSQRVPVTLGVFRSLREPKQAWLGLPKYAPMAGALWLPQTGLERVPVWIQAPGIPDRLRSLSDGLAATWYEHRPDRFAGFEPMIQRYRSRIVTSNTRRDGFEVGEVLANHAGLSQLVSETVRFTRAEELLRHGERIRGRLVILGQVDQARDRFLIPGRDNLFPGVYVHASAALTLANEPVYEFSHAFRIVLDLVVSFLVLAAIVVSRRGRIDSDPVALHASEGRTLGWAVAVTLVVGFLFVGLAHVLWLDFLLGIFFLLLHPTVEGWFHRVVQRGGGNEIDPA